VIKLDTNQYNTKPAGNQRKKNIKIKGLELSKLYFEILGQDSPDHEYLPFFSIFSFPNISKNIKKVTKKT